MHATEPVAELLVRLATGDESALAALYHDYHPRLHRYARSLTHTSEAAEEVVHDVFLSLWNRRASLAIDDLTAYLFRAVRLRATDVLRHSAVIAKADQEAIAREIVAAADALVPEERGTDRFAYVSEIYDAVQQVIARMPPARAAAARLRWVDGLTVAEVGGAMGISVAAAQMHVSRARSAIAEALARFR